jgi:hypothetical protein
MCRRVIIAAGLIAVVAACWMLLASAPKPKPLAVSIGVPSLTTDSQGWFVTQCVITNASGRPVRIGGIERVSEHQTPVKPKEASRLMLIAAHQSLSFQIKSPSRDLGRWRLCAWIYEEPGPIPAGARTAADKLRDLGTKVPTYEPGFEDGVLVMSDWTEWPP